MPIPGIAAAASAGLGFSRVAMDELEPHRLMSGSRAGDPARPARREEGEYREYLVRHEGAEDQWMKDPPE